MRGNVGNRDHVRPYTGADRTTGAGRAPAGSRVPTSCALFRVTPVHGSSYPERCWADLFFPSLSNAAPEDRRSIMRSETSTDRRRHPRTISKTTAVIKTMQALHRYDVSNLSVSGALLVGG